MTWNEIWNNYINLEPGLLQVALRLTCAMVVGIVIGLEREFTHRPAGLRTHILVALGACVASVLGEMIFCNMNGNADPARISAQVITGVGFLGAGTIMKEGVNVKGLTTAASVWAVACLGLAAGFGYYALALAGMVFTFVTLTIFEGLQRKLVRHYNAEDRYEVLADNLETALESIHTAGAAPKTSIYDLSTSKQGDRYSITFRVSFVGRNVEQIRRQFYAALVAADGICTVSDSAEAPV